MWSALDRIAGKSRKWEAGACACWTVNSGSSLGRSLGMVLTRMSTLTSYQLSLSRALRLNSAGVSKFIATHLTTWEQPSQSTQAYIASKPPCITFVNSELWVAICIGFKCNNWITFKQTRSLSNAVCFKHVKYLTTTVIFVLLCTSLLYIKHKYYVHCGP